MSKLSLVALLGLGIAAALPAQDRGIPDRIAGSSRATLEHLVDSVRAAGLPVAPLYDKAAEGVLKGADDARIVLAVRTLTRELGEARAALGTIGNEPAQLPLLTSAASALHAGMPVADLRRLAHPAGAAPSGATLATALVTLVDLVAKRVPVNVATSSIQNLIDRRATDRQFSDLRAGVEADIAAGRAPEASVAARVRAELGTQAATPPE